MVVDQINKPGKIFAIGDIHGCYLHLKKLLERLPFVAGQDILVFLGDYLDRTSDSAKVIELLCRLRQKTQIIALLGNHENLLLEYHRTGDRRLLPHLRQLGIEATVASYGGTDLSSLRSLNFMPENHRDFLQSLRPYWETDEYIFVHAGLVPGLALEKHSNTQLCEGRNFVDQNFDFLGKTVIFGHTPFETPFVTDNRIGIDTGAAYGNMLTAVELPTRIFYHSCFDTNRSS